jgi:hypothetical protein
MSHAEFVNEALTGRECCMSVGSEQGICGDFSEMLRVSDESAGQTPGELTTCHQKALPHFHVARVFRASKHGISEGERQPVGCRLFDSLAAVDGCLNRKRFAS